MRRRHVRDDRGVPIGHTLNERTDLHPFRERCDGREERRRFEVLRLFLTRERVEVVPGPDGLEADLVDELGGVAPRGPRRVLRPERGAELHVAERIGNVCDLRRGRARVPTPPSGRLESARGARDDEALGGPGGDRSADQRASLRLMVSAGRAEAGRHRPRRRLVALLRSAPHPRLLVRPCECQPRTRTSEGRARDPGAGRAALLRHAGLR